MPSVTVIQVRRARWAISAVFAVFGILFGSWLPHIPDVKLAIHCDDAAIGRALICSGLGAVVSMQFLGRIIHRFGTRNVAVASGAAASVLVPILVLNSTLLSLGLNLLVLGAFYGSLDVAMNSHAVEVQDRLGRPMMSSVHGCFSLGGILGGITASAAASLHVSPFGHLLGTSIAMLLLLSISYPNLLSHRDEKPVEGPKFVMPHGALLLLGLLCALAFVAEGGILDWSALYVRDTLKANIAFGGIATGFASGAMAVGRFFGDPIVSRMGHRAVVSIGGAVCTIGVLVAVTTASVFGCIAGLCLACFGLANIVPTLFSEARNVKGIPLGTGVSAVSTLAYGGFLLGPPVIGFVAQRVSLGAGIGSLAILGILLILGARGISATSPNSFDGVAIDPISN